MVEAAFHVQHDRRAAITLLIPWIIFLWYSLREYERTGLWLLIGAPVARFWPVATLLLWLACMVPGSDCM